MRFVRSTGMAAGASLLHYWFLPATVRRAVGVALVVGPLLTVINQHEALVALDFPPRVLAKIALTFLVPYAVSSYSSAVALAAEARDTEVNRARTT